MRDFSALPEWHSLSMSLSRTHGRPGWTRVVAAAVVCAGGCDGGPSGPSENPWPEPYLVFASERVDDPASPSGEKDLFRASLEGDRIQRISHEPTHVLRSLHLSPVARRIVVEASWEFGCPNIFTLAPDGSERVALTTGGIQRCNERPRWSRDGSRIAFTSSRQPREWGWSAWVMGADGSDPTLIPRDSASVDRSDWIQGWTPGDRVILSTYFESDGTDDIWTYTVNPDGSDLSRLFDTPQDHSPFWSPDGTQVAFVSERNGNADIYLMDADGSNERRLTDDPGADTFPWLGPTPWSPDGSRLVFHSDRSGAVQLYVIGRSGGSALEITSEPEMAWFNGWSPDGRWIAFESRRAGNRDVFVVGADGEGLRNVSNDPADDGPAVWIGGT